MGLPSLTLNADLAKVWPTILQENGLSVSRDESEKDRLQAEIPSTRVGEVLWRVRYGNAEIRVLEATMRDQMGGGNVFLVFMPTRAIADRQMSQRVREILIASGAK